MEQLEEDVAKLREHLSQLWDRLEVSCSEREQILENFPGHSRRTREGVSVTSA